MPLRGTHLRRYVVHGHAATQYTCSLVMVDVFNRTLLDLQSNVSRVTFECLDAGQSTAEFGKAAWATSGSRSGPIHIAELNGRSNA